MVIDDKDRSLSVRRCMYVVNSCPTGRTRWTTCGPCHIGAVRVAGDLCVARLVAIRVSEIVDVACGGSFDNGVNRNMYSFCEWNDHYGHDPYERLAGKRAGLLFVVHYILAGGRERACRARGCSVSARSTSAKHAAVSAMRNRAGSWRYIRLSGTLLAAKSQ